MMKILLLLAGGAFGTLARYSVSGLVHKYAGSVFPFGTLTVNIAGAFIIGLAWGFFEVREISPNTRTFLFIGLLGGFTTFSTYALETLNLFKQGDMKMAFANILANNVFAIVLVFAGFVLARGLLKFQ